MPRTIGYGKFSPARQRALKKAQLASAKARRKNNSEHRAHRKRRNRQLGLAALGAAAAIGAGAVVYNQQQNNKEVAKIENRLNAERGIKTPPKESSGLLAHRAETKRLKEASGNIFGPAENQEQLDARTILYGDVIGEFSDVHEGRAEIFPTLPRAEVVKVFQQEAFNPSYSIFDDNPNEEFLTLYHRTGGGNDHDPVAAKASILQNQGMQILNRDEKRADPTGATHNNNLSWWSNKLNDSNTRAAFGEHVVTIKISKKHAKSALVSQQFQSQGFGKLSPIKESWAAITPEFIAEAVKNGAQITDVPGELITPPPPRKFKAKE